MERKTIEVWSGEAEAIYVDGEHFSLAFPVSVLAEAEKRVGHPLKHLFDWFNAPLESIPVLVEYGLKRHHPDAAEAIAKVVAEFTPEELDKVQYALCWAAFPKAMEKIEEAREKGNTSPNV